MTSLKIENNVFMILSKIKKSKTPLTLENTLHIIDNQKLSIEEIRKMRKFVIENNNIFFNN